MKPGYRWIVVDTETDGFMEPVHVVEIAAQAMDGWNPAGEPFRVLINHEIQIDTQAQRIHGYTEEFLRENGLKPYEAHAKFAEYVGESPIVSHNLAFDWDRALLPEWQRLGLPAIGRRGFCTLKLSRRIIPEAESHSLDELKLAYNLSTSIGHKAHNDVTTLVELLTKIAAPRLARLSLDTFDAVDAFSLIDTKKARAAVSSIYGQGIAAAKRHTSAIRNPVPGQNVYHVARDGTIIGEFLLLGLYNGIQSGELRYDDYYWSAGMGDAWLRLREIEHMIRSAAPRSASPKQIAFLSWFGVDEAASLTEEEASAMIEKVDADNAVRADGASWNIDRLILHPDMFRSELNRHLSGKIRRECLRYYDGIVFESTNYPDGEMCKEVFNRLSVDDPNWWAKPAFPESFYKALQIAFPKCCDGKSVYLEKDLPANLHLHIRSLYAGCSEKLTKAKIRGVMKQLSDQDCEWYSRVGFETVFASKLREVHPGCCDGRNPVEVAVERDAAEVAALEAEIRFLLPDAALPVPVDKKLRLGLAYYRLSFLTQSPHNFEKSFEWFIQAAHEGSIQAARHVLRFSESHAGFNPPLSQIRLWIRFALYCDEDAFGMSNLNALGTPESRLIISVFDPRRLYESRLSEIEAQMTAAELAESDAMLAELARRVSTFR